MHHDMLGTGLDKVIIAVLTNKENSTVLCSVVKHAGSSRVYTKDVLGKT